MLNPYRWFKAQPKAIGVELVSNLVLPMQKALVKDYGLPKRENSFLYAPCFLKLAARQTDHDGQPLLPNLRTYTLDFVKDYLAPLSPSLRDLELWFQCVDMVDDDSVIRSIHMQDTKTRRGGTQKQCTAKSTLRRLQRLFAGEIPAGNVPLTTLRNTRRDSVATADPVEEETERHL